MDYPTAEALSASFALTKRIIEKQTDGLSHEDSVLQLPFRGNCLNWVLGHIIVSRNAALQLVGEPQVWGEEVSSRYRSGSEPITNGQDAQPLTKLLADLARTQQLIESGLQRMAPEGLAADVDFRGSKTTIGKALAGLHWHETYHTGQFEILRQLAGTDDALI